MLAEFSLKLVYTTSWVGQFFKFMVLTFLENALNLGIFTHVPPNQNSTPSSCHHTLGRRKLLIPPGSIFFFENLFPPTPERGRGNYDLLYQNPIRKYEDDLGH